MKILKTVVLVVLLLAVPGYAFSAGLGYMRISLIEGDVQIKTSDAEDWGYASINTPLAEGDQIWAPRGGRVELQLNGKSFIRLDENSALQILSLDRDSSQFYLSQGNAYVYYDAPRGNVIQVDTPDASTRAFDMAIFRIDMSEQYTDVAVYKGNVETENQVGRTRVRSGQMVSLGQNTDGEIAPMGPSDAWETWNKKRNDRILARRGTSSNYLPAELHAYSYDFDDSGRWVQDPDYGYVWTPTIVVGVSWSPYRDGRWIWRGGDYIWVGFESWGWAPYHYGRWSFRSGIGWFWVPPVAREVYWSPGYVGWVRTSDYVGWVPLAPGETYYGRGNYGRHSVNITNVNINQVNITNVYRNASHSNGATIVHRNTFATASPRIATINQNDIRQKIFTKNNLTAGTPEIKPTRESYFASTRSISQAKLPPQAVRNIQTKQLKQSRPFIKEADKSVLNPSIKPKDLPVKTVSTPRTPGKGKPMIKQFKPDDKDKSTVRQRGPAGRDEKEQFKPADKKPPVSERVPAPKVERRTITPVDREKEPVKQEGPTGRAVKKQFKPADKKPAVSEEDSPAPKVERRTIKPVDREKEPVKQEGPTGRAVKKQFKPADKKPAVSEEDSPAPKVERRTIKPVDREKEPVKQEGPTGRAVKKQFKPADKKPAVSEEDSPAPKVERKAIERKPVERKAIERKPVERKAIERKPVEKKAIEKKAIEKKAIEKKAIEKKAIEKKAIEEKAIEKKAIEKKAIEKKAIEEKADELEESPQKNRKRQRD